MLPQKRRLNVWKVILLFSALAQGSFAHASFSCLERAREFTRSSSLVFDGRGNIEEASHRLAQLKEELEGQNYEREKVVDFYWELLRFLAAKKVKFIPSEDKLTIELLPSALDTKSDGESLGEWVRAIQEVSHDVKVVFSLNPYFDPFLHEDLSTHLSAKGDLQLSFADLFIWLKDQNGKTYPSLFHSRTVQSLISKAYLRKSLFFSHNPKPSTWIYKVAEFSPSHHLREALNIFLMGDFFVNLLNRPYLDSELFFVSAFNSGLEHYRAEWQRFASTVEEFKNFLDLSSERILITFIDNREPDHSLFGLELRFSGKRVLPTSQISSSSNSHFFLNVNVDKDIRTGKQSVAIVLEESSSPGKTLRIIVVDPVLVNKTKTLFKSVYPPSTSAGFTEEKHAIEGVQGLLKEAFDAHIAEVLMAKTNALEHLALLKKELASYMQHVDSASSAQAKQKSKEKMLAIANKLNDLILQNENPQ